MANRLLSEKRIQASQNGANGLVTGEMGEALVPVVDDFGVADGSEEFSTKGRFEKKQAQLSEGAAPVAFEKSENAVLKDAFHLVAPGGREPFEDGHEIRSKQRLFQL